ncbi:transcriptional regulator [Priestia megaterium]|nr:transcriptional regulator [Priestia megaterium]
MDESQLQPRFYQAAKLLEKRWNGLILSLLVERERSFSEMEKILPFPGRLIVDRLQFLESNNLIKRKETDKDSKDHIFYPTDKGRAVEPLMKEL